MKYRLLNGASVAILGSLVLLFSPPVNGITINGAGVRTPSVRLATPETLVADLYKAHDAKQSPFFQKRSRARVDKYFTKRLADLIWKDVTKTPKGEVGKLDGDPLYNAQDMEIKAFAIGKATVKGST